MLELVRRELNPVRRAALPRQRAACIVPRTRMHDASRDLLLAASFRRVPGAGGGWGPEREPVGRAGRQNQDDVPGVERCKICSICTLANTLLAFARVVGR